MATGETRHCVLISTYLPAWRGGHPLAGSSTFFLPTLSPYILAQIIQPLHDLNHTARVYSLSHGWSKPTPVIQEICRLTQDKGETSTLTNSWKLLFLRLLWDMGTWWSWAGLQSTLQQGASMKTSILKRASSQPHTEEEQDSWTQRTERFLFTLQCSLISLKELHLCLKKLASLPAHA